MSRVLIADDPAVRAVARQMLEESGYEVLLVEGAAVPVAEYLRRHPERRSGVLAAIGEWLGAR